MRRDLIEKAEENRKKIESVLATAKRGMTLSEIAEATGLPVSTVRRHLNKLVSIGRVHVENHRGSNIYIWNGQGEYTEKVYLSKNHVLYIDAMINPWGRPFIRVKESKRIPGTDVWEDIGAILIDGEKVYEFISKLTRVAENLKNYGEKSEQV